MRRLARVDANQPEIVDALRAVGASVRVVSMVGQGFADILVGWQGKNYLMEIKNPKQREADQALTADEARFAAEWRGQYSIVKTVEEALALLGIVRGPGLRPAPHGGPIPAAVSAGMRKNDEVRRPTGSTSAPPVAAGGPSSSKV